MALLIETNDIGRLGLEVGIVAGHIPPEAMRLKTGLAPDLRDVRLGRSQLSGQTAGAPLGGSSAGFAVQSPVDDPCFELLSARCGLTAAMPTIRIWAKPSPSRKRFLHKRTVLTLQRSLPLIARNESPRPRSRTMRALRPSSLRALRLLAIFASSRRSGGLMTKGAAMLSSIT